MTGHKLRMTVGVAALAMGAILTVGAARAQPYGYYGYDPDQATNAEGFTVYAPRAYGRSPIGADIEAVRESRIVYARDLDLSTPWGAHALRRRIERAARDACDDLDARYPVTADAAPDCFQGAVRGAMTEVQYRVGFTPPDWY